MPITTKSYKLQLTIDPSFGLVLNKMRSRFPLVKDVDLIKLATSGFYTQNQDFFYNKEAEYLDQETSDVVEQSILQLKNSKNLSFKSGKDLIKQAKTGV